MSEDAKTYLTFCGAAVKALPDGRLSGRIVTFSSAHDPDRAGEFFTAATDFWKSNGERLPILYRHGVDPDIKRRRFGEATISRAADGVWCSGYFHSKDADSEKLLEMARNGELNFSTGATGHLVETTPVGNAKHIDSWPLAELSLCPKGFVAEPRNILSLKAFIDHDEPGNFYSLPQSVAYEEHQRELEQRAKQIYVQCLMRQHELRMQGF